MILIYYYKTYVKTLSTLMIAYMIILITVTFSEILMSQKSLCIVTFYVFYILSFMSHFFLVPMSECFPVSLWPLLLCPLSDTAQTATYIWAMISYIRMIEHMAIKLIL